MEATNMMGTKTDDALITETLAGSTAAFDALYERHFQRVYGFVARRSSPESEVEDIVQNVFIHAFTNLAGYRSEATFLRWLYGITRNVLRRHFLNKSRAQAALGVERLDVNDSPDLLRNEITPEREATARQIGKGAMQELDKLSPEAKEQFLLHHVDGVSIKELSAGSDRTSDSLKSDFYRIRKKLNDSP